ncbi:site-specific integrase [Microbacterium resistens]|uniref:site-specific integrase n=1 Tax=Microbacterium resistens TaxID=156977 RepID=UPI001C59B365|nr:tyrosine-type recombinase/integrase [Microbacterium resistens]MBW1639570.1 site-specific integrase [Microbacterium resistens]
MSARQRGSSIKKVVLANGETRWRFRVDVEPRADGKRRQRTLTFRTEAEAVNAQARARADIAEGTWTEPSRVTVDEWLTTWLDIGERTWRPSTHDSYKRTLALPRRELGHIRLQKLTRADVEALVRKMSREGGRKGNGRSPRTITLMLDILGKALKEAVREGLIGSNVVDRVRKPRKTPREMSTWTAEQMSAFLSAVANDPLVGVWHVAALGLRRGELLGMRWSDVDLDAGTLHIRQARVQAGRSTVIGDPKTERGRRIVPLHVAAVNALRETRRMTLIENPAVPMQEKTGGERLIAVDALGNPITPAAFSTAFQRHSMTAGLPRIRLHDMRHSAISLLLQQGVPVVTVARLAGHDPALTMTVYAHATDDTTRVATDLLGRLYGS